MTNKVCVKCRVELRCKENGVGAITVDQNGRDLAVWDADLWACPSCGFEAVLGFGAHPVAEHFQPEFEMRVGNYPTVIRFWLNERERDLANGLADEIRG